MPLQRDVIRSMIRLRGREFTRQFMIDHYTKTPEGIEEKRKSPRQITGMDPEALVDTILRDAESEMR